MNVVVRIPETELERLDAWAERFHLAERDPDRVDVFYEAELERDELDALCREHGFTCAVDDDGMGEVRSERRVVARVRGPGRIL